MDKGAVLDDPGFGFGRFGLGPIPQCVDAGMVISTQGEELGIFRYEPVDGMFLVRKSLIDMIFRVIQYSFSHFRILRQISTVDCIIDFW